MQGQRSSSCSKYQIMTQFVAQICRSISLKLSDRPCPIAMCSALLRECSVKIYTVSYHLCKVFHQSPGCSAMCLTAKLCKLKESEGKEQLWQSLPRTAKVMKTENGPAIQSHYRWWLDIRRGFCRCLQSWNKEAKALKGDIYELFYCIKLVDQMQQTA